LRKDRAGLGALRTGRKGRRSPKVMTDPKLEEILKPN